MSALLECCHARAAKCAWRQAGCFCYLCLICVAGIAAVTYTHGALRDTSQGCATRDCYRRKSCGQYLRLAGEAVCRFHSRCLASGAWHADWSTVFPYEATRALLESQSEG